jgi:hypothetical protein
MVVGAVICLCLAALIGGTGLWTLRRPAPVDLTGVVMRAVAPTQLAAGVMFAAAGVVALTAPHRIGLIALIVGIIGAVATLAVGSWQGARYVERRQAGAGGCGSAEGCGGCAKVCGTG